MMTTATPALTWSAEQQAIFGWFREGSGHLLVRARAGTGKTTTILHGVTQAPEPDILVCAFNKRIAEELQKRLGESLTIQARTLHSLGYSMVQQHWKLANRGAVDGRARAKQLGTVLRPGTHWSVQRLVTQIHTKGRELTPLAKSATDLEGLCIDHDLTPEKWMEQTGWKLPRLCQAAFEAMALAAMQPVQYIDYADMLYLPIKNGWIDPVFDLVVVDEAQDMTGPQLHLATGMTRPGGRICLVGDDRQAIYGFRGADTGSLDRLKKELVAGELGLKTTYRCGITIVDLAKSLVPDFEAGAQHQGRISETTEAGAAKDAEAGDFILSRLNAPLMPLALKFLREERRCRIQGRDIGKSLIYLAERIHKRDPEAGDSIARFLQLLDEWETEERDRALKADREDLLAGITDRAQTLDTLGKECRIFPDLLAKLEFLFADEGEDQIILSTVHKAKGLEARRVFILKWTLDKFQDRGPEEANIRYVAITRAKEDLVWIVAQPRDRDE